MCREELGSQVAREGPRTPRAFFYSNHSSCYDFGAHPIVPWDDGRTAARAGQTTISRVSLRLGVDTGGTFTDFVRLDSSGLVVFKLRSTPDDASRAILEGVAHLTEG